VFHTSAEEVNSWLASLLPEYDAMFASGYSNDGVKMIMAFTRPH
jgi:hypothetical protein